MTARLAQLEGRESIKRRVAIRQRLRVERQELGVRRGQVVVGSKIRSVSPCLRSIRACGLGGASRGTQTFRRDELRVGGSPGLLACDGLPTLRRCGGSQAHVSVARMGGGVLRWQVACAHSG